MEICENKTKILNIWTIYLMNSHLLTSVSCNIFQKIPDTVINLNFDNNYFNNFDRILNSDNVNFI